MGQATFTTARLCCDIGAADPALQAHGMTACALLKRGTQPDSYEMADVCELEATLLAAGRGGLTRAAAALAVAVETGDRAQAAAEAKSSTTRRGGKNGKAPVHASNKRKAQLAREQTLRSWMLELGLIDETAEAQAMAERTAVRDERAAHDRRKRAKRAGYLDSELEKLAPEIATLRGRHEDRGLCIPCSPPVAGGGGRLPWDAVPEGLKPSSSSEGGIERRGPEREAATRVTRKMWQLESVFTVLREIVAGLEAARGPAATTGSSAPPIHVVDFGSGSGNSALVFAALLPQCQFTLVDAKQACVDIGARRTAEAGLTNTGWWHGDVAEFSGPFDVGLATHLCGDATDAAQAACLDRGAAFVLTPCCVGKIKRVLQAQLHAEAQAAGKAIPERDPEDGSECEPGTPESGDRHRDGATAEAGVLPPRQQEARADGDWDGGGGEGDHATSSGPARPSTVPVLRYPRSSWLGKRMATTSYLHLIRLADFNRENAARAAFVRSKQLIDLDRAMVAVEAGYRVRLGKMSPLEASVKNDVLVGIPGPVGPTAATTPVS